MDYLAELSTFLLGFNIDSGSSEHPLDQRVDELLSVSESTISLSELMSLDLEAAKR
jgi:hypothetical protein